MILAEVKVPMALEKNYKGEILSQKFLDDEKNSNRYKNGLDESKDFGEIYDEKFLHFVLYCSRLTGLGQNKGLATESKGECV